MRDTIIIVMKYRLWQALSTLQKNSGIYEFTEQYILILYSQGHDEVIFSSSSSFHSQSLKVEMEFQGYII